MTKVGGSDVRLDPNRKGLKGKRQTVRKRRTQVRVCLLGGKGSRVGERNPASPPMNCPPKKGIKKKEKAVMNHTALGLWTQKAMVRQEDKN